jgi:Kef-type K+ transport system membrane component KefB
VGLFVVVLLVARPVISPGSLDLMSAARGLGALVVSAVAGAAAALALVRVPGAERRSAAWTLVALAFIGAAVARLLHVEPVLMMLAAGVLLGRFAPAEGECLRHGMQQASPVVYTVLFALLGAGLRTDALAELWPWVALLVGLRVTGLRYGAMWAARTELGGAAGLGLGWRGLVSQAGVVAGLAHVARRAFPEWGVSLETLVVTMIGVHEVAGPLLFRRALAQAGEIPEERHAAAPVGSGESAGVGIAADRGV